MITVTIKTAEVRHDIKNRIHITARSMEAGDAGYESVSAMQPDDNDDNSYDVSRAIGDALTDVKLETGEYLDETHSTADNLIAYAVETDAEVILAYDVPSNFDDSTLEALSTGLHEYMVSQSIYRWLEKTSPSQASVHKTEATAGMVKALKALYRRRRPSRPVYTNDAAVSVGSIYATND